MAILTLDGVLAGGAKTRAFHKQLPGATANGRWSSFWGGVGAPGAGGYDATLNGAVLSGAVAGRLPFTNPAGAAHSYLSNIAAYTSLGGSFLMLADRLWHNEIDETSTGAQAITFPTLPARDINGATDGDGVMIALEVAATMGAATPTTTSISYTNSAGTSGRTGTLFDTTSMSAAQQGAFWPFLLQAGDTGVRSVQSITLSASWVSGTVGLVAYRPIAEGISFAVGGPTWSGDLLSLGFPRLYDDSVLFMLQRVTNAGSQPYLHGDFTVVQG